MIKNISIVQEVLEGIGNLKLSEQLKYKKELLAGLNNSEEVETKIQSYLSLVKQLSKYHNKLIISYSTLIKEELKSNAISVNGITQITGRVDGLDVDAMKTIAFQLSKELQNVFIVLGCAHKEKALLTLVISNELVDSHSLNAAEIIRDIAKEIKGGGGGQPFFATAGGIDINGIEKAFERAIAYLS